MNWRTAFWAVVLFLTLAALVGGLCLAVAYVPHVAVIIIIALMAGCILEVCIVGGSVITMLIDERKRGG